MKTTKLLQELELANYDLKKIDSDLGNVIRSLDTSSNRLTLGVLAGATFVAAALLMPYDGRVVFGVPAMSFFGFSLSLLLMLALMISILREKH